MTLRYHYSPRKASWTRCVASNKEACPFGGESHGDRSSIAIEHGGGVMTYHQVVKDRRGRVVGETVREFTVTPVIEGIYGVVGINGSARTYRADNGEEIPAGDRPAIRQTLAQYLLAGPDFAPADGALVLQCKQSLRPPRRAFSSPVSPQSATAPPASPRVR